MRFLALLTAGLAALADAYHKPVGAPKGNPIYTPGLNQQVPKGSPFKITWKPTTQGTVTLVLLRGPSTNVKPIHVIAHKIPNNGHHEWIPNMDLQVDKTHYGLQLIVDKTGQYQYSTQFGIAKPKKQASREINGSGSRGPIAFGGNKKPTWTTEVVTDFTTYCPHATTIPVNNVTYTVTAPSTLTITNCPCTVTHSGTPPSVYGPAPTHPWVTYQPSHNVSTTRKPSSYPKPTLSHPPSSPPSYTTNTPNTPNSPASTHRPPHGGAPGSGASAMYSVSFAAGLVGVLAAFVGL